LSLFWITLDKIFWQVYFIGGSLKFSEFAYLFSTIYDESILDGDAKVRAKSCLFNIFNYDESAKNIYK